MIRTFFILALYGLVSTCAFAQVATPPGPTLSDSLAVLPPAPPAKLTVTDYKYDAGEALTLSWELSPDDPANVIGYKILMSTGGGAFDSVAFVPLGVTSYIMQDLDDDSTYQFKVAAVGTNSSSETAATEPVTPQWEFFNFNMWNIALLGFIVCASVIGFIISARAGMKLFIRKISGLEALEEAVGRATEMGRPILFIPGILDMDDVQTLAAITILSRVSRIVADYDSQILMPVSRSLVMTSARETIKESYLAAGRPDAYSDDMAFYITDEQFGYVAAVNGLMVREQPATCLYLGAFFAESLILAETGNFIGAIQIAGTARPGQLPFFVAACDYTLIGEELFAASAYLSGDPKQLGSLKGQDVGKFVAMAGIAMGTLAATLAAAWHVEAMHWFLNNVLLKIFSTH